MLPASFISKPQTECSARIRWHVDRLKLVLDHGPTHKYKFMTEQVAFHQGCVHHDHLHGLHVKTSNMLAGSCSDGSYVHAMAASLGIQGFETKANAVVVMVMLCSVMSLTVRIFTSLAWLHGPGHGLWHWQHGAPWASEWRQNGAAAWYMARCNRIHSRFGNMTTSGGSHGQRHACHWLGSVRAKPQLVTKQLLQSAHNEVISSR